MSTRTNYASRAINHSAWYLGAAGQSQVVGVPGQATVTVVTSPGPGVQVEVGLVTDVMVKTAVGRLSLMSVRCTAQVPDGAVVVHEVDEELPPPGRVQVPATITPATPPNGEVLAVMVTVALAIHFGPSSVEAGLAVRLDGWTATGADVVEVVALGVVVELLPPG